MRFLMLNWRDPENPISGGAERVSLAYLSELVRRGHEVYWFANDFPGAKPESEIQGIKIIRSGGKGSSILKARRWYRRQKPFDLIIDQHHGIPWYAPWWSEANRVAYIHEVLGPIWDSFYKWPFNSIGRAQERWTHWLYRHVAFWTPSDSTRKILAQHGVKKIHVFPNGTDTKPIEALEPKKIESPLRLITVSRLAPNKRVDQAIRAVAFLVQRQIDARLTIVGTGEVETQLKQLVEKLGLGSKIEFAGLVDEAKKNLLLQQAHFLLHTSLREGWGLNVIEANAMGTPAIVYPVDGLVDSTIHGETGFITQAETPESLADAIAALVKTPEQYEQLRLNAWQRAKNHQWQYVLPLACDWLEAEAARQR